MIWPEVNANIQRALVPIEIQLGVEVGRTFDLSQKIGKLKVRFFSGSNTRFRIPAVAFPDSRTIALAAGASGLLTATMVRLRSSFIDLPKLSRPVRYHLPVGFGGVWQDMPPNPGSQLGICGGPAGAAPGGSFIWLVKISIVFLNSSLVLA